MIALLAFVQGAVSEGLVYSLSPVSSGRRLPQKSAPRAVVDDRTVAVATVAAKEKALQNLEEGTWEPIVIARNIPEDLFERFYHAKHVYWYEEAGLWTVTLYALATTGHETTEVLRAVRRRERRRPFCGPTSEREGTVAPGS